MTHKPKLMAHIGESGESPDSGKLPGAANWSNEGIDTDYNVYLRHDGRLDAVMLFVDFPNAPSMEAEEGYRETRPYYEWFIPNARTWYRNSSYGTLQLRITPIHRWYRMSRNDAHYGFERGISFQKHVEYIHEAVKLAEAHVDFSKYDLVYVVPSKNAAAITFSPAYVDETKRQIVSNGAVVAHGATFGQDMWRWGYKVLVHETSHTFGLPDLYAFETKGTPPDAHYYVGGWDVMGLISGHAPEHLGWHKWKLGWLKDSQVDAVTKRGKTKHVLSPIERADDRTKMVVVRTGKTSAYVIESRRPLKNDSGANDQGVLIYKVNSDINSGYGPIQIISVIPEDSSTSQIKFEKACFGLQKGKVATYNDRLEGVTVNVIRQGTQTDFIEVIKASDLSFVTHYSM